MLSVIVPFHNVEKYMRRCALSLFNQTLCDIEYIFVDDASSDNSKDVLNEALSEHPERRCNTRIITNETNIGASLSRKKGLELAEGDYTIFCDADDWVDPDYYQSLYSLTERENNDIVVGPYIFHKASELETFRVRQSEDYVKDILLGNLEPFLWNKIVRTNLYKSIEFPSYSYWEDFNICVQIFSKTKKTTYFDGNSFYHYNNNPNSITNGKNIRDVFEEIRQNLVYLSDFLSNKPLHLRFLTKRICDFKQMMIVSNSHIDKWHEYFPDVNELMYTNPARPLYIRIIGYYLSHNIIWPHKLYHFAKSFRKRQRKHGHK